MVGHDAVSGSSMIVFPILVISSVTLIALLQASEASSYSSIAARNAFRSSGRSFPGEERYRSTLIFASRTLGTYSRYEIPLVVTDLSDLTASRASWEGARPAAAT